MEIIILTCILTIATLMVACGGLAYHYGLIKGKAIVYNELLKKMRDQYYPEQR